MSNIDFMIGMVIVIVVVGFIYNRYFNDGGWDE